MATYSTDFSGGTVGSPPSGWTLRQDVAIPVYSLENIEGAAWGPSGQTLKCVMSGDAHHLYCWDTLDSASADMDLLTLCRASNNTTNAGCSLATRYANSSGSNWHGYIARRRGSDLQLIERTGLTESQHASRATGIEPDEWTWMRLRVNGSDIKAKLWAAFEPEPTDWLIEITDATTTAAGWSGLMGYDSSSDPYYFAYFAAGSGGDTAPMLTYGTPEVRLSSLLVEYLIRNDTVPTPPASYVLVCVN